MFSYLERSLYCVVLFSGSCTSLYFYVIRARKGTCLFHGLDPEREDGRLMSCRMRKEMCHIPNIDLYEDLLQRRKRDSG